MNVNAEISRIFGLIGAFETLLKNFPMGIFERIPTKKYSSTIEFIVDLLQACGIPYTTVCTEIIEKIFGIDIVSFQEKKALTINEIYQKIETTSLDKLNTQFFENIEDKVKVIISDILVSIFSCSAIPWIPKKILDNYEDADYHPHLFSNLSIPVELIDYMNILFITPTTDNGKTIYTDIDSSTTINTLYKSKDGNAFLWYCLNRGSRLTQPEKNKMMWDSRNTKEPRTEAQWEEWINSEEYNLHDGTDIFPILQVENGYAGANGRINISLSSQRYGEGGFKLTNFNKDYLESIRIFNPKLILRRVFEGLMGLRFSDYGTASLKMDMIDAKVNQIIDNVLMNETDASSICYYTFSNEELDMLLKQTEQERYGKTNNNSGKANITPQDVINAINNISSSATPNELTKTITNILVSSTTVTNADGEVSLSLSLGMYDKWWRNLILNIVRPIASAVLTPQVLLLFAINFQVMGIINLQDITTNDTNKIMKIIVKKIMGSLAQVVILIKDAIIEIIRKMLNDALGKLVESVLYLRLKERIDRWRSILRKALNDYEYCIIHGLLSMPIPTLWTSETLDNVNYADIIPVPESTKIC